MMSEPKPTPAELSTFTGQIRAPGAIPTTPALLSSAPIVPETCVPWPLSSSALLKTPTARAVLLPRGVDVQVRMVKIDAGIDDRHVDVNAVVGVVDPRGGTEVCIGPIDPAWKGLRISPVDDRQH